MNHPALVEIRDVAKRYGDVLALESISFRVER